MMPDSAAGCVAAQAHCAGAGKMKGSAADDVDGAQPQQESEQHPAGERGGEGGACGLPLLMRPAVSREHR